MIPDGAPCPRCRAGGLGVRRVVALADYRDEAARTWVLRLKHGGRADLAAALGRALARRLAEEAREPPWSRCLVPVPLHPLRRLERGLDQAALLARAVSEAGGGRRLGALRRVRATLPQGDAAAGVSRAANVAGAFRLRRRAAERIRGAACWLVDDVVTSGATAAACARELRRGGARWVGVLCVARAAGLTERPPAVDAPGP